MLDLQACIHFNKIELVVLVKKLDCANTAIAHTNHRIGNDFTDFGTRRFIQDSRRCFFQNLLVATLQRAIALAQMHGMAVCVTGHLNFNMARLFEVFLNIYRIIAKRGLGFGARCGEGFGQIIFSAGDFHAATTAT